MIGSLCCCCCADYILGAKSYNHQYDDNSVVPMINIYLIPLVSGGVSLYRSVVAHDGSFNYNFVGLDRYGHPFNVTPTSSYSYVPDLKFNTSCNLYVSLTLDKSFEEHFDTLVSKILSFEQIVFSNFMYDDFLKSGLERTCRSGVVPDIYGNLIISGVKTATRIAVFNPELLNDIKFEISEIYQNLMRD